MAAPGSVAQLEELQRTAGNAAVQRLWSAMAEAGRDKASEDGGPVGNAVPARPTVAQRLATAAGRGRALDAGVRRSLESSVGVDLSEVRVHDDAEAAELTRATGALAFTTGRDIYFGSGGYQPHTPHGFRTLAHETAHVVQQARGPVAGTPTADGVRVSDPGDADEQHAEHVADDVVAGRRADTGLAGAPVGAGGTPAVQRACGCGGGLGGCGCGPKAGDAEIDREDAPALQRLAAPTGAPVVQRKKMTVGDLDVDVTPRVVLTIAFQAPGGRVEARRGIPVDDAGRGIAQLADGEEAVGVDMTDTFAWKSGNRPPGPAPVPPGPIPNLPNIPVPPELQAACNPCLILSSGPVQAAIRFAPKSVRDMAQDCTTRKTFAERRDFVETFLKLITADPCILLTESPAKVNLSGVPVIGPILGTVGIADACRVARNIPLVASVVNGVSTGLQAGLTLLRKLPAEAVCKNITPIDPPNPNKPKDAGNAVVRLSTRFLTQAGALQPFGPAAITNLNGTGASIEQPVSSGRTQVGNGANLFLAPALLRSGTPDRGQDLIDIDVLPPAPPTPVNAFCADSFSPFVTSKAVFQDEPRMVTRIHTFFHTLHPRVKQALANGQGLIEVVGRASRSGPEQDNVRFAEQRATRVETELRRAAGTDAKLRARSTGSLAAVAAGNAPEERRADVEITVRLEGEAARGMSGQNPCEGGTVTDPLTTTTPVTAPATATDGDVTAPGLPPAPAPEVFSEPVAPLEEATSGPGAEAVPGLELPGLESVGLESPGFEQVGLEQSGVVEAGAVEAPTAPVSETETTTAVETDTIGEPQGPIESAVPDDLEELMAGV